MLARVVAADGRKAVVKDLTGRYHIVRQPEPWQLEDKDFLTGPFCTWEDEPKIAVWLLRSESRPRPIKLFELSSAADAGEALKELHSVSSATRG